MLAWRKRTPPVLDGVSTAETITAGPGWRLVATITLTGDATWAEQARIAHTIHQCWPDHRVIKDGPLGVYMIEKTAP